MNTITKTVLILILGMLSLNLTVTAQLSSRSVNQYVNPFIGTAEHGHTYPGAQVPFGMVQLSPDNGFQGWDWCSGYNYADSVIVGFSHTHLSGTGIGDLYDLLVMPAVAPFKTGAPNRPEKASYEYSLFSHKEELAEPGYYRVLLKDYGIFAELTATERAGMHRYSFPANKQPVIILNLQHAMNWDAAVDTRIEILDNQTIAGYRLSTGWANDQHIYFVARFSQPFIKHEINNQKIVKKTGEQSGDAQKGYFWFSKDANKPILLKIGISAVSVEGAMQNLEKEIPGWDFDDIKDRARLAWEKSLDVIKVSDKKENEKTIFYTALYHSMLAPTLFSDVDGSYRGADGKTRINKSFVNYTTFSLWDTYRASHPLFCLIQPDRVNDMVSSLLAFYKESGLLPKWPLVGCETGTMTGYHAVPVIVEAYLKGYRNFDAELAYEAVKKSAMQDVEGIKYWRDLGYIPADKENESVSKALEYAYDDWCIAQFAKALGKQQDYELFLKRAGNYRNFFDASTGFMRGKMANGEWRTPFNPFMAEHRANDYTEGNAWQYTWLVPHDPEGLIQLMGGKEKFSNRLDSLFLVKSDLSGKTVSPDISGLIGQYAQGNEPGHHTIYLYNYAGKPWKTAEKIQYIRKNFYKNEPNGIIGNDDCGQMSAWYVFGAMGFYPVDPSGLFYAIGSPEFERLVLKLPNNKIFEVVARNLSDKNIYIKSALLNGRPFMHNYITHQELMQGGRLEFVMDKKPSGSWGVGKNNTPPSMTH